MENLRITIFEDNRDFRESLIQLFRFTNGMEVAGAFPDCNRLKEAVLDTKPDVILMDVDMPGMNGIEATAIVKEIRPQTQVIILTVSEEEERIFKALQNGATGYLLKKTSPDDLIDSVHSVVKGGSPMTPAIARKVLQFFYKSPNQLSSAPAAIPTTLNQPNETESTGLSPRELEILEGLVDGLSYKMIAAKHYISPDTVKNHIQGIYRKLQVHSKGEAITLAIKTGIVKM